MKVFIAGVMQGNKKKHGIYSQDYRHRIAEHVRKILQEVEIIDPDLTDPNRLSYDDRKAAEMFFKYCKIAGGVDLLIAYLPEASMGSAVEMWLAYNASIPIITISSLKYNWIVRLLSSRVYPNMNRFESEFGPKTLQELNFR